MNDVEETIERDTNMRNTRLVSTILALAVFALIAADAHAMYDPKHGRFLQRDPGAGLDHPVRGVVARPEFGGGFVPRDLVNTQPRAGQAGLNNQYADGMNLYQYVQGNPVCGLDPLGLQSSRPGPGPGGSQPSSRPACCCCCADGLYFGGINKIFGEMPEWTKMPLGLYAGHDFGVGIKLGYKSSPSSPGDCALKWEEEVDNHGHPGVTENQWNDMYKDYPGSSCFDDWNKHDKPCPGTVQTFLRDAPAVPLHEAGANYVRHLKIRITVESTPGCKCAAKSRTISAIQVLTVKNGAIVWSESSFTINAGL